MKSNHSAVTSRSLQIVVLCVRLALCGCVASAIAATLQSPKGKDVAPTKPKRFRVVEIVPPPDPLEPPQAALIATNAAATNVVLAWDPPANTSIKQYNVYRGTRAGAYTTSFSTPGTTATYSLVLGATNFFAVTTVNTSDAESDWSNEVSYRSITNPPSTTNYAIITLASTNMVRWTNISTVIVTNSEPFMFFKQQILKVVP